MLIPVTCGSSIMIILILSEIRIQEYSWKKLALCNKDKPQEKSHYPLLHVKCYWYVRQAATVTCSKQTWVVVLFALHVYVTQMLVFSIKYATDVIKNWTWMSHIQSSTQASFTAWCINYSFQVWRCQHTSSQCCQNERMYCWSMQYKHSKCAKNY